MISLTNASKTFSCTYTRSVPMQVWPALDMPPHSAASAALVRSASSSTISESLPPASISTGVRFSAHAAMTFLPVGPDPVNASLSMSARAQGVAGLAEAGDDLEDRATVHDLGERVGEPLSRRRA